MPAIKTTAYATRLLNPFQGTAQIVDTGHARAVSTDGVNWRLQIRSEIYKTPWSSLAITEHYDRYFVYGVWSQQDGLARVPVHPSLYQEHVTQAAEDLLIQLEQFNQQVPFALRDSRELWLMDADGHLAIALLSSQIPDEDTPIYKQVRWTATANAETPFTTMAYAEEQARATIKAPAQDLLIRLIRQRCKRPYQALWVERQADGSGTILHNHAGKPVRRHEILAADIFPTCLLSTHWHAPVATQLVTDYLHWQAPLLLMLPLPLTCRRELERQAQRRPLAVHRYHRLYPAVYDKELLNKILVEAVLRKSSEES